MIGDLDSLSVKCRRLLRTGEGLDQYDGKHKALAALCGGMHKAGWSSDQALHALLDTNANMGSAHLYGRFGGSYISQILSKWRASERRHAQFSAEVDEWAGVALREWPFDGRQGAKLRVLLGLAAVAHDAGKWEFTLDNRTLAIVAGVGGARINSSDCSTTTARRAVKWLQVNLTNAEGRPCLAVETAGTLAQQNARRRDAGASSDALDWTQTSTTYRLPSIVDLREAFSRECNKRPTQFSTRTILWMSGPSNALAYSLHPLWEHAGLGMNAARLYALMSSTPGLKAKDLSTSLGFSLRSAQNVLAKLSESRMAESQAGSWIALQRDLDEVADEWHVANRPALRRNAAGIQRQNYREAIRCRHRVAVPAGVDPFTGEIEREPLAVVIPLPLTRRQRWTTCPLAKAD